MAAMRNEEVRSVPFEEVVITRHTRDDRVRVRGAESPACGSYDEQRERAQCRKAHSAGVRSVFRLKSVFFFLSGKPRCRTPTEDREAPYCANILIRRGFFGPQRAKQIREQSEHTESIRFALAFVLFDLGRAIRSLRIGHYIRTVFSPFINRNASNKTKRRHRSSERKWKKGKLKKKKIDRKFFFANKHRAFSANTDTQKNIKNERRREF